MMAFSVFIWFLCRIGCRILARARGHPEADDFTWNRPPNGVTWNTNNLQNTEPSADDLAIRRSFLEHALLDRKYETGQSTVACAICLDEYEPGDRICRSFNRRCNHVFHHACILDWLMHDDTCPCCRQGFLTWVDSSDGGSNHGDVELGETNREEEIDLPADDDAACDTSHDELPANVSGDTVSLSISMEEAEETSNGPPADQPGDVKRQENQEPQRVNPFETDGDSNPPGWIESLASRSNQSR